MLHQMGEIKLLVKSCFHLAGFCSVLSWWKQLEAWSMELHLSGSHAGSGGRRVCGVWGRQIMTLLLDD